MKDNDRMVLTTLKSYLAFCANGQSHKVYSVADVKNSICEFTVCVPQAGKCQWHMNTDFSIQLTNLVCLCDGVLDSKIRLSDDAREIIAEFDVLNPCQIAVRCQVDALNSEQKLQAIKAEYGNRVAHIAQLMQSERDLQAAIAQKESTLTNVHNELNYHIQNGVQLKSMLDDTTDKLQRRDCEYQRLTDEHDQLARDYQQLQNELLCREGECQQLRDKENRLKNDLEATRNSRTWRIGKIFTGTARFFIPVGSKRALFCRLLWTMVRHPSVFFKSLSPRKIKKFFRLLGKGQTENINLLIRSNVTGEPAPSAIEVSAPLIVAVDTDPVKEKTIDDYPVLTVPQWDSPQVSIVIPVYNQFEFTYHCVESIMKNSGDITYEIIIANDCSTDLTTQIDKILPGVNDHGFVIDREKLLGCYHCQRVQAGAGSAGKNDTFHYGISFL